MFKIINYFKYRIHAFAHYIEALPTRRFPSAGRWRRECNMAHATCYLMFAICHLPLATCGMQCDIQKLFFGSLGLTCVYLLATTNYDY